MKKVLVIEDNQDNLRLISYPLQRSGYEVVWAASGEEGVKKALEGEFSLIIMDINLPGIDGIEATKRIRQSAENQGVPIVAITSFAMLGDREIILGAGCNGYLEKPIDPLTVMDEIEKMIETMNSDQGEA
ncbi:MAG: response regulator [Thermodesulfobacteriota bacterium]